MEGNGRGDSHQDAGERCLTSVTRLEGQVTRMRQKMAQLVIHAVNPRLKHTRSVGRSRAEISPLLRGDAIRSLVRVSSRASEALIGRKKTKKKKNKRKESNTLTKTQETRPSDDIKDNQKGWQN